MQTNKSKIRDFMIFLAMFLFSAGTFAQQRTITGTVTESNGDPLVGVSVLVKGTTRGTTTNVDGKYTISVNTNEKTLIFRSVGMETKEMPITGNTLNVTLYENLKTLDEVVVIGYGTTKRKDLTGSVSTVKADEITATPTNSVEQALQGKLAGVQITTTEGSPDAEVKIRVRGGGSITGDNTPLYIVDGFPVSSISDIAPSNIEDITVLKDASSTAIYGSRGANGVILVTTKKGKSSKLSVNYSNYIGFQKLAKEMNVLSPSDYTKWQYELALLSNNGASDSYEKYFGLWTDHDLYDDATNNDWQKLVFGRIGNTFNQTLSLNGGSDKANFNFNYSHLGNKAIMQMSNFSRDNLSLNLGIKPNEKISFDFNTRFSSTGIQGAGANEQNEKSSQDSRLKYAVIYYPFPIKDLTNSGGDDTEDSKLYNPLTSISDNDHKVKRITYNMGGAFNWNIINNLRFRTELGYDDYRNNDQRFYGTTTYYAQNLSNTVLYTVAGLPAIILTNTSKNSIRNTNTLSYDFKKLLSKDHSLNVMIGEEYILTQQNVLTMYVQGFPDFFTSEQAFKLASQSAYAVTDNYYSPNDKLLSYFGRTNYNYLDKYLLTCTFRADGSSKFSEGHKWGYFPSAALAWRISSEQFMKNTGKWLDDLKIRFSYGTAGNNNIPSGQVQQSYAPSSSNYWVNNYPTVLVPSKIMANPDLTWETTYTRNLGIDYSLFNSKLSGSIEAYFNTTNNLLINFPVTGSGYTTQYRNMGETQNKGLEFSVNWVAVDTKNFGLTFNGNINFNRNKINSLGEMSDFYQSSGWASSDISDDFIIRKGGQVGEMYGYIADGKYNIDDFVRYDEASKKWILKPGVADDSKVIGVVRPGSLKLKNIVGSDSLVTEADKTIIGNANPLHTGGFNVNVRVYNLDIAANFYWSYGNKEYNANKIEWTTSNKYQYRNMISTMADGSRWTNLASDGTISNDPTVLAELNENTTMWSPYMTKYVFSSWAVEDGSFLRLSTLTVGYNFPTKLIHKLHIDKVRLYATGYNLLCITNYTGYDPEASTRRQTNLTPGVDYSAYPRSRQLIFGLNINL